MKLIDKEISYTQRYEYGWVILKCEHCGKRTKIPYSDDPNSIDYFDEDTIGDYECEHCGWWSGITELTEYKNKYKPFNDGVKLLDWQSKNCKECKRTDCRMRTEIDLSYCEWNLISNDTLDKIGTDFDIFNKTKINKQLKNTCNEKI